MSDRSREMVVLRGEGAGGAYCFGFSVLCMSRAMHVISGNVDCILTVLWNHQRQNKYINHCLKICVKEERSPVAIPIIPAERMRT